MAVNWKKAFHLPVRLGFRVVSQVFDVALRALTATSLEIISITIQASTRSNAMSMIRADVTKTLSAIGSKKRPKDDSTLNRLAMKPSKKSVSEAIKNMKAAIAEGALPGKKSNRMIGGTKARRPNVKTFGRYFFIICRDQPRELYYRDINFFL